jgi:hypothetical protein
VDADLAGGLIKQRVARQGQGRRGGYRTLTTPHPGPPHKGEGAENSCRSVPDYLYASPQQDIFSAIPTQHPALVSGA